MRVTNAMTSNQLLLNLNKNMSALSFLQYQSATGNKIRYASDDPIVAGRTLKFRTNIVETEQYMSNSEQGRVWMQTSANAVKNIMEAMVNSGETSIRSILVSAANGTNTITDSKIYSNQLRETLKEVMGTLNADYAGRYIFSGYKTDHKPVLDVPEPGMQMKINESLDISAIDPDFRVYVKSDKLIPVDDNKVPSSIPAGIGLDDNAMPQEISVHRLKLAYSDGISGISGLNPAPIIRNTQVHGNAYLPADNEIYYLEDTGELIFGKDVYADIQTEIAGNKTAADTANAAALASVQAAAKNNTTAGAAAATTAATAALAQANALVTNAGSGVLRSDSYDILTDAVNAATAAEAAAQALETAYVAYDADPTSVVAQKAKNEAMAAAKEAAQLAQEAMKRAADATQKVEISYTKTGFAQGDINPKVYFECTDLTTGKKYDMNNQTMMYEFGVNNKMQINTLAKDVLTTGLINDINDAITLIDGITLTDRNELVAYFKGAPNNYSDEESQKLADEQLADEEKFYTDLIEKKFTELIGKLDKHMVGVSQENTSIGSKLSRLDLISNRLQDDRINFEELKVANENVDMAEAYIRYQSMSAVYQSALQMGARIVQMTLVNYI